MTEQARGRATTRPYHERDFQAREPRPAGRGTTRSRLAALVAGAALGLGPAAATAGSCANPSDYYTSAQAAHGKQVVASICSACHGDHLQGGAGPPLAGSQFESYLKFSGITAPQLFDFITSQMPYNKPGSLSERQYLDALAYIFQTDGYPGGHQALSRKRLQCLHLLPYPNSEKGTGDDDKGGAFRAADAHSGDAAP